MATVFVLHASKGAKGRIRNTFDEHEKRMDSDPEYTKRFIKHLERVAQKMKDYEESRKRSGWIVDPSESPYSQVRITI